VLSCYKSPGAADTNSAQRRLFETLVPHAIRSVMLHRRLHHLELGQEAAVRGLDHLQQGLLFVDSQARVLFANNTARKMLDARDGLRLEDGCLSAAAVDQGHRLRRVVASCVDDSSVANGPGGEVDLARDGRLPLHAVVMPLADESAAIHLPWIALSRPVAMVLVSDPEAELQTRVKRQCKRFGFTAAETTFALEIVSGGGRRAAAERLGITVTTARTHLSSIFEKTGTHRQAELVYLLLRPV